MTSINGQQRVASDLNRKVDGSDFLVTTPLPMVDTHNQTFAGISGAG